MGQLRNSGHELKVTDVSQEIEFEKYQTRGAYHWEQISMHPTRSNAFVKARYSRCLTLLITAVNGLNGKRVLDLGCGDGVLTWKLHRQGACAHGADASDVAIRIARKMHDERGSGAEFRTVSGYDTGYPDSHFDAVISSDVIEHVRESERLLKEIRRVLKPGGATVISTPIRLTERPIDPMHVMEWFPEEFQGIIGAVFPKAAFSYSHAVFWMELFQRNKINRALVNLLALFRNPFMTADWRFQAMQYALAVKQI
jgi:2-polyprenyl-3-methyl-5-hydroxy-6-metoxy-1,4-benzoquinol methylase